MTVSVTDGHDRVAPGSDLIYAVTVQESVSPSKTADVSLTLPPYVNTVTPSDGARQVGNLILWDAITLSQNQAKVLTVHVSLLPTIPDNTQLIAKAQAGNDQATDTTVVQSGLSGTHPFLVSITDNATTASPGDQLTYIVAVKNTDPFTEHTDVNVTLSGQVAIDDVNPATTVSYPSISWKNISFGASEQKLFTITATINKRVTAYTAIRAQAAVDGVTASDSTTVQPHGTASSSSRSSVRSGSSSSSASVNPSRSVLFRKVADSAEVVPGGTIHYTLYVQNILLNVIHNAVITDRFDPNAVNVADAGNGTVAGDGQLQWALPTLQPGQEWKTTYSLKVNDSVPNGTTLNNIATLNGSDVTTATLNEKVTVATANVVGYLPTTGAAFDILFLLAVMPLAIGAAALQKSLR